LVGIVSRADLVRVVAQTLCGQQDPAPGDDHTICAAVVDALSNPAWANTHGVTASVHAGVVTLDGVIFDDDVRRALHVAAENVSGVKRVDDKLLWMEPLTGTALGA
jgi:hypothetical protein